MGAADWQEDGHPSASGKDVRSGARGGAATDFQAGGEDLRPAACPPALIRDSAQHPGAKAPRAACRWGAVGPGLEEPRAKGKIGQDVPLGES